MAKSYGQKSKILYILKYLEEESSINNPITTKQIIDYLEKNGITAERKSIYDDIESLKSFGVAVRTELQHHGCSIHFLHGALYAGSVSGEHRYAARQMDTQHPLAQGRARLLYAGFHRWI